MTDSSKKLFPGVLKGLSGESFKPTSLFDILSPLPHPSLPIDRSWLAASPILGSPSNSRLTSLAALSQPPTLRDLLPPQPLQTSPLSNDLEALVKKIFREQWSERKGQVVPEPDDLALGNDGVQLDATVIYADMSGSTQLVDSYKPQFSAEVYKTYLACAARIIKTQGGAITAYDGDRIMGVFIGGPKNTNAVTAALKINGAVWDIVKPALRTQYAKTTYNFKHVIGIDTSKLLVSRIGVRNDNDLVWVGRAANYAAKLSSLSTEFTIYITHSIYDVMLDRVKYGGVDNTHMWKKLRWTTMDNMDIYATTWKFGV